MLWDDYYDNDYENFTMFDRIRWTGMTKEEVANKITELFGIVVTYTFDHKLTVEYMSNHASFEMENDVVVRSYWG